MTDRRAFLSMMAGAAAAPGFAMAQSGGGKLLVYASVGPELRWYDAFGVLLRPRAVFARRALSVESRRPADAWESASLGQGLVVVECRTAECGGPVELAMSEAALTGFLAWLESAPPGRGNSPR